MPSKTGTPEAVLCRVMCRNLKKDLRTCQNLVTFFSLTKLSFSKWPNWPYRETEFWGGGFVNSKAGVVVRQSLTLENLWSLDGALKNARCWFLEKDGPSNGAKWRVVMTCHPRHHPSVLPLFDSWFLGLFWCLCTHVMFESLAVDFAFLSFLHYVGPDLSITHSQTCNL